VMEHELGHEWCASEEWHPMFRMHLTDPTSWKPAFAMDFTEYWFRQATLGESAGLTDDDAPGGWRL
jgi:hypothetical protein